MEKIQLYANKADIARIFGIGRQTVYANLPGIEREMDAGRYNRYAILDGKINIAVFADYMKYRARLRDRNLRKTVPPFNLQMALTCLLPEEHSREEGVVHG